MLAVCNAGSLAAAFATPAGSSCEKAVALGLNPEACPGAVPSTSLLDPLTPQELRLVQRWGSEGRDDNYSGSAAAESAPVQFAGPVAAIFVSTVIALVALAIAKWPQQKKQGFSSATDGVRELLKHSR